MEGAVQSVTHAVEIVASRFMRGEKQPPQSAQRNQVVAAA
jgi:hypothetical protein